ncbi:bifunctional diguanylate cyclase/phosphodiesterase [Nocardioides sp. BP30]|uniref:putative bifunctional diguanylate cyclase/phosphodiesterase n=1 Tax=Nocardioides sp. BP30 TaxID=3036374 RepID=UPI002469A7E8|nr:bifunctional diguanylate cyclase/phosphodiesterase [Nocardioides sp. BP30]WGL50697.1 bifunctional diguanylate cyclase/phosphodiesterase [Nocardioides sp. BP30]
MARSTDRRRRRADSTARSLLTYGLVILVPVVLLGAGLVWNLQATAKSRGLAQARSAALLLAQTAVAPQLDGRGLSAGMSSQERGAMARVAADAVADGRVLRLQLRDERGAVAFSYDRSSGRRTAKPPASPGGDVTARSDDDVAAVLTHLDAGGTGTAGPAAVAVSVPLTAGSPAQRIGTLDVYLPYAPYAADVAAIRRALYRDLALWLLAVLVCLGVAAVVLERRRRTEASTENALVGLDALTGLPNRALFMRHVEEAVTWVIGIERTAIVAVMDLDNFKNLNDTLGHASGDELLGIVARRLTAGIKRPDVVSRLGGDEFGLVLRGPQDPHAALTRLAAMVSAEAEVGGRPLSVAPSVGYVQVSDGQVSAQTLMQQAEVAMYAAKSDHTVIAEYAAEMERFGAADMELITELPHALSSGQLALHYQPQIAARSGAIIAVEALVRWNHPVHGLLPPGRFLPMAEQTDLIERLTAWVLERALKDMSRLSAHGTPIRVCVNVSARSVVRTDFVQQVTDALRRADLPASQLVIEVTETALLTNPERARSVLEQLAQAGVHVSIDDFGQGQTSLGYLANLPIAELKIDRAFVTGMATDQVRKAIARTVIDLGHNLSMRVVAEGVETAADLDAVRDLGCDLAQGYHIAHPMALGALAEHLSAHRSQELSGGQAAAATVPPATGRRAPERW